MELPAAGVTEPRRVPAWLAWTLLLTAGLGLRLWVIAHSEVAARDSIGYIRYALRFENEPFAHVVRTSEQPPGYAMTVWLVSQPVRAWTGRTDCETMVTSAQLASAIMAVLAMVPMVLLGRDLVDRRVGWIAAIIFVTLPAWMRLTSDGLTEGTFLFWTAVTGWLGVRALRRPTVPRLFLCGLTSGVSYLVRPEGLELAAGVGCVLAGMQLFARWRQPWRAAVAQALALALGVAVCVGLYVSITGKLTNKNTGLTVLGDKNVDTTGVPAPGAAAPSSRTPLAVFWSDDRKGHRSRAWWAVWAVGTETVQSFHYVGAILAAFGAIILRSRASTRPAACWLTLVVAVHAVVLWRMAYVIGYLSERHTLLFVFFGSFPAAAALLWLGRWHRALPTLALVALVASTLPALGKSMHSNRCGHKAAGLWLAKHVTEDDLIYDPFGWAEFYTGRLAVVTPPEHPARTFSVWETSDNQHSRLPGIAIAKKLLAVSKPVYHWPESKPLSEAVVVVFDRCDGPPKAH